MGELEEKFLRKWGIQQTSWVIENLEKKIEDVIRHKKKRQLETPGKANICKKVMVQIQTKLICGNIFSVW